MKQLTGIVIGFALMSSNANALDIGLARILHEGGTV